MKLYTETITMHTRESKGKKPTSVSKWKKTKQLILCEGRVIK